MSGLGSDIASWEENEREHAPPRLSAAAVAGRRAMHRQATDTPARRALERDISGLLQELDAMEGDAEGRSPGDCEELTTEQTAVAQRLSATVAALRALALTGPASARRK